MSRWRTEPPLQLWLGADCWVLRTDSQVQASGPLLVTNPAELPAALRAIALPGGMHGRSLQVVIDDRWCRSFVVQVPSNVQSSADLDLCMSARMQRLFGDGGQAWSVVADQRAAGAFAACALPGPVHAAIIALAAAAGASLASLTPLWVHACQRQTGAASPHWMAVQMAATASLVYVEPAGVLHVRTVVSPAPLDAEALQRWLQLEQGRAAASNAGTSDSLRMVHWNPLMRDLPHGVGAPSRRSPRGVERLDLMARRGWWRWPGRRMTLPLSACALLLAVTGFLSWIDVAAHAQARASLHATVTTAAAAAARRPARGAAPTLVAATPLHMPSHAVNAVVQRLNMPWPRVLDVFDDAAAPDIALLQLAIDTPRAHVRASALARDEAAMFDYVKLLNAGPVLVHARVTRHAVDETAPGQPIEFAVEAQVVQPSGRSAGVAR